MSDAATDRGLSRKHILASIARSLRRIGTDYIDLYIVHAFDPETPIGETMETLDGLVRAGKVRYLGASTIYAWQFALINIPPRPNPSPTLPTIHCHSTPLHPPPEPPQN